MSAAESTGRPLPTAKRIDWGDLAPTISLVLIVITFGAIVEDFFSFGTFSLVLQQGAVLAIAATGLTFVLLCAEIDLSVGMVALMSACLCGVLWEQPWAAGPKGASGATVSAVTTLMVIVVPLMVATVTGWISGQLTVSSGLPSFIITLAMMNITLGLAKFATRSNPFQVPALLSRLWTDPWNLFGLLRVSNSTLLAAFVMMMAHLILQHTRFGRYVYMTGGNRDAARLAGVQTGKIVVSCMALCALTAALAGIVNAGRLGSSSLDQNAELLLDAVACVVLGGTSLFGGEGSIGRTVIGVLTFTTLKVGLNLTNVERLVKSWPLPADWKVAWLKASWVTQFDLLRPFLLGVVLLLALVIHGRLVKRRD